MNDKLRSIVRLEVPCPHCGKTDLKRVSELVANNSVPCGFCREPIDVSSKQWRTTINEISESLGRINIISPKGDKFP